MIDVLVALDMYSCHSLVRRPCDAQVQQHTNHLSSEKGRHILAQKTAHLSELSTSAHGGVEDLYSW